MYDGMALTGSGGNSQDRVRGNRNSTGDCTGDIRPTSIEACKCHGYDHYYVKPPPPSPSSSQVFLQAR